MKTNSLNSSNLLVLLFLITIPPILSSQDISDTELNRMRKAAQEHLANKQGLNYEIVDVQLVENKFVVKYDLNESSDAEYVVSMVFLREGDPMFKIVPKSDSGAIGTGKFAGKGNVIVWKYKNDHPEELKGDDFYFVLDIRKIQQSSMRWLWMGLGSVAAGGALYFILTGKDNTTAGSADIPRLTISRPN